jgi:hypothetical protein
VHKYTVSGNCAAVTASWFSSPCHGIMLCASTALCIIMIQVHAWLTVNISGLAACSEPTCWHLYGSGVSLKVNAAALGLASKHPLSYPGCGSVGDTSWVGQSRGTCSITLNVICTNSKRVEFRCNALLRSPEVAPGIGLLRALT